MPPHNSSIEPQTDLLEKESAASKLTGECHSAPDKIVVAEDASDCASDAFSSIGFTEDIAEVLKIVVVGPSGVGKSCLIYSFTDGEFLPNNDCTIGVEFAMRVMAIDEGKKVKLQIWDTAGQESFRSITSNYYRGAHGALLVFDITQRNTFLYLDGWLAELKNFCDPFVVLVGSKADLAESRTVTYAEALAFAKQHGLAYFETSAKKQAHAEEVFTCVARGAYAHFPVSSTSKPAATTIKLPGSTPSEFPKDGVLSKGCCP